MHHSDTQPQRYGCTRRRTSRRRCIALASTAAIPPAVVAPRERPVPNAQPRSRSRRPQRLGPVLVDGRVISYTWALVTCPIARPAPETAPDSGVRWSWIPVGRTGLGVVRRRIIDCRSRCTGGLTTSTSAPTPGSGPGSGGNGTFLVVTQSGRPRRVGPDPAAQPPTSTAAGMPPRTGTAPSTPAPATSPLGARLAERAGFDRSRGSTHLARQPPARQPCSHKGADDSTPCRWRSRVLAGALVICLG